MGAEPQTVPPSSRMVVRSRCNGREHHAGNPRPYRRALKARAVEVLRLLGSVVVSGAARALLEDTVMKDVAVVGYCRTGIAQGVPRRAQPDARHSTGGACAEASRRRARRSRAGEIEDVILGCGLPQGATGHNIARTCGAGGGLRWRPVSPSTAIAARAFRPPR